MMDKTTIILISACIVSSIILISLFFLLRPKHKRSVLKNAKLKKNEEVGQKISVEIQQKPIPKLKIIKSSEEKPFKYFHLAEEERKLKNFDEAIRLYNKNLDINREHAASYFYMAKCLQDKELYNRAIRDYFKAIKFLHDKYECYISLAICNFNLERYPKAVEYCDLAIKRNIRKSDAYYWKGFFFFSTEDYRNASLAFIEARGLGCQKSNTPLQICLTKFTEQEKKHGPEIHKPVTKGEIKDNIPLVIAEKQKEDDPLFVNYDCKLRERNTHYPILKVPIKRTVIRSHRYGKTNRRGIKEDEFQNKLEQKFSDYFEISGNVRMNKGSGNEPYEPDIALISKTETNIRIDIEIDEPYSGIDRQPTHYTGKDNIRDAFFKNRGWIVIRFSELQVHKHTSDCLKYLASVIDSLDSTMEVPGQLITIEYLNDEPLWSHDQCRIWERENYREKYLNHQFKVVSEHLQTQEIDLNEKEIAEEQLVITTPIIKNKITGPKVGAKSEKTAKRIVYNTSQEKNDAITRAIATSKNIQFKYQKSISFSNGKRSIRTIKPEMFETYPTSSCVKGYCFGRKEEREFNLDRISELFIDPEEIIHWEEDNYDRSM